MRMTITITNGGIVRGLPSHCIRVLMITHSLDVGISLEVKNQTAVTGGLFFYAKLAACNMEYYLMEVYTMKLIPVNGLPEKVTHREYLKAGQKALEEFKKIPDKVVEVTFTKEEYSNPYSAVCMMNQIIVRDCLNMAALMRDGKSNLVKLY